MATMADEESELLLELEKIDPMSLYFREENFWCPIGVQKKGPDFELFKWSCAQIAGSSSRKHHVQGRDLDWLKCYSLSDLQTITDEFKNKIRDVFLGTLFQGKIGGRDVVVKTWSFCHRKDSLWFQHHPSKFKKTIKFFMEEGNKAHESLPKLIGYTIEKKLAVVYDVKASRVLPEELESGDFAWEDRLNVAFKLAKLLEWFHSKHYVVGAIDGQYILVDEDYNVTFYQFDLLERIANEDFLMTRESLLQYGYGPFAPDCSRSGWTVKSDVYAYGTILLSLIMRKALELKNNIYDIELHQSQFQHEEFSLVHGCFKQEWGTGIEITRLALSCLDEEPQKRPYITEVVGKLKPLIGLQKGRAKRKRESSHEEQQDISPLGA